MAITMKSKPGDGPEELDALLSSCLERSPAPSCTAAGAIVEPNSIWPIHDPASPAAKPERMGFRWRNEG
jgi:hypothetical protein